MTPDAEAPPVLVTGATGFIGREVVRRLLATGRSVVALGRGRDGRGAADRLGAAVGLAPDGGRLAAIEADLVRPGCGIASADWARLRAGVETVVHCAGETTFFPGEPSTFRTGHVDGPLALLQGLEGGRLRRWAQLSTAYVCGRRSGTVFEGDGDVGQSFHNPYERVKLEAEARLRGAAARAGVAVRVFRPSVVVGAAPTTTGGQPSNLFFDFIRLVEGLARLANGGAVPLRIAAAPRARFNIVPVEYVAAALVALIEHPGGVEQTFHLVVSDAPTQAAMLEMITARLGVRGLVLVDHRDGPLVEASALERRVARMLAAYREYLEQDVHFDDTGARRLLADRGVAPPRLSPDTVQRLVDLALAAPHPRQGVPA
jgi:thioester reductase-like protein